MEFLHGLFEAFESAQKVSLCRGNIFMACPVLDLSEWVCFEPASDHARPNLGKAGKEGILFL